MSIINVKMKKLSEDAIIPTYGTGKSAGLDIYSIFSITLTGHPESASIAVPSSPVAVSFSAAIAVPSGPKEKTPGQVPTHIPQPIHPSFTLNFIFYLHAEAFL